MSKTPHTSFSFKRTLYFMGGALALISGIIGIVLPVLPTTPFILLAAWCFARSSERFHTWLVNHRHFGKLISDWEKYRGITQKNKNRAYWVIALGAAFSLYTIPVIWVKLLMVPVFAGVFWHMYRMNTVPEK
ncbi:YbaN family protein [Sansalvadorimonas verongulae]|uniref:YbaN family protein n=1 Tax=Sansalvadorimonas verongulae TaxID=2172824 RepID=UPI0012BBA1F4|nr:YbaN family protein [Sansalvadorimonas verongulae]MTI15023.1 DUF454 domain-containing protein [Sansalvadorimonas verongulae]